MKIRTAPYLLQALSPLHAGTGHAAELIDLPIARMKATGIPFVPGSSIKGVLREEHTSKDGERDAKLCAVFGPLRRKTGPELKTGPEGDDHDPDADHAGALIVGDARLLSLPVRSFKGTFVSVTSPLLLRLAHRDLAPALTPLPDPPEPLDTTRAQVTSDKNLHERKKEGAFLYLEDLDLPAAPSDVATRWAEAIAEALPEQERAFFTSRLAIVDDETMTFLWETATQLDTRVRIDRETGTVAKGALWTEESLPPETLLIGLLAADRSRHNGLELDPAQVLRHALPSELFLQFGGKATVGRGRCRIAPWPASAEGRPA
jgi:CRISPR-associated protein Cmr4